MVKLNLKESKYIISKGNLKIVIKSAIAVLLIIIFSFTAGAQNGEEEDAVSKEDGVYEKLLNQSGADKLLDSLSDEAKDILKNIGITGVNPFEINNITFSKIINVILNELSNQTNHPFKTCFSILGIMILYAALSCFNDSLAETSTKQILDIVTTLCITCALVLPVSNVISQTMITINSVSKFILAYVPVMVVVMIASGSAVSGSSYYSSMIIAGQGVAQVSSKIISPLLNVFLGLSVVGTISPEINLKGLTELAGKVIKWTLAFVMTIFTGVLSFKTAIASASDRVSSKAVKFTLSSFVPVVGSALADAYKTVESSISLLKSGIGVIAILCVGVIFLPILSQCVIWLVSLYISKSVSDILNLSQPSELLESVICVLTTLFAVILCVMAIFIISTAVIMMMGGGSS